MDKAGGFDRALMSIMSWLPGAEDKLAKMAPVSADPRNVRIQIEEMKVCKRKFGGTFVYNKYYT